MGGVARERKDGGGRQVVTLDDALKLAVAHNRQYQFRKETLYLAALTLTGERHEFAKRPFASLGAGIARASDKDGRTVNLDIPSLAPTQCYELRMNLTASDQPGVERSVHGTIHQLSGK